MKMMIASLAFAFLFLSGLVHAQDSEKEETPAALDFTMKTIDGKDKSLADYEGRVLLVVNVASQCGLTPQYAKLQSLHEKYSDQGLSVLGFPCNQFGKQEPGSESEIQQFCEENYGVSFDMFSKINVNGEESSDFYKYLTALDAPPKGSGDVSWNFEKFLIDRKGNVIGRFGPRTDPTGEELTGAIEKAIDENQIP